MQPDPTHKALEQLVFAVGELVKAGGDEPTALMLELIAQRVREGAYSKAIHGDASHAHH